MLFELHIKSEYISYIGNAASTPVAVMKSTADSLELALSHNEVRDGLQKESKICFLILCKP